MSVVFLSVIVNLILGDFGGEVCTDALPVFVHGSMLLSTLRSGGLSVKVMVQPFLVTVPVPLKFVPPDGVNL